MKSVQYNGRQDPGGYILLRVPYASLICLKFKQ